MVQVGMGTSHVEVMAEVEARWNVIGRAVNNEMSKLKRKQEGIEKKSATTITKSTFCNENENQKHNLNFF